MPSVKCYTRTCTASSNKGNGHRHKWTQKWVAPHGSNSSSCFTSLGVEVKKGNTKNTLQLPGEARKEKGEMKDAKGKKSNHGATIAATQPTLDEELKTFKAIIRHITTFETEQKAIKWFQADNRPSLRRLGNLGIMGHQPAIAAYCKMTKEEKEKVTDAIMKQKVANNPKAEKQLAEHRERSKQDQGTKIIIHIARIAVGASVRWERKITNKDRNGITAKESNRIDEKATYHTRMLACTKCGTRQETKGMQLKINIGFRAIHCKSCGKQERVLRNKCVCDAIWHQWPIHRIDPLFHSSKKSNKRKKSEAGETGKK